MKFTILTAFKDKSVTYLLKSLGWQADAPEHEVLVVNCSGKKKRKKGVKFIDLPLDEWHKPTAINCGIAHAKGEYIIIACSHCLWAPNLLAVVNAELEPETQLYHQRFDLSEEASAEAMAEINPWRFCSDDWDGELHPLTSLGDFGVFHRETLMDAGGYDERMSGWGYIDTDLSNRLPHKIKWIEGPGLFHLWHERPDNTSETHKANKDISKQGWDVGRETFEKYVPVCDDERHGVLEEDADNAPVDTEARAES